jgi:hypothetical protein
LPANEILRLFILSQNVRGPPLSFTLSVICMAKFRELIYRGNYGAVIG